jgi:hypothetical protein
VGVIVAVKEMLPTLAGVQLQVALPLLVATLEHPEIVEPPALNRTEPSWEVVAVIVTGALYVAEVLPPGSEIEIVGDPFSAVIVT